MSFFARSRRFVSTVIAVAVIATGTVSQTPQDPDDVIRISTELVQTGVVVLDKQGKFVPGLKAEQFVLKVEGKPVTPAFFEQVTAGSDRERKLEKAVGRSEVPQAASATGATSYRGRTIIFFIDDLHLSKASVESMRKAMYEFVDKQMSADDLVAVASPTGQIGFLQRFTDIKPVVRAAVNRINYRPYTVRDHEHIPMSEYQALRIEQGDKDATEHYVSELMKQHNFRLPVGGQLGPPQGGPVTRQEQRGTQPGMTKEAATRIVQERAGFLMRQSESVTTATLSTLESLMRSSSELPGRKLVFLISDGFFLNDRSTGFGDKLKRITDAAVRSGVIVYSLDARGMTTMTDASSNRHDSTGRLSRADIGELAASQDALNALAVDTGGKAFFNTGRLTEAVNAALDETSNYYLLAWRPSSEDQKVAGFKRVEISIAGRPDLTVRMPRGFMTGDPKASQKTTTTPDATTPLPAAGKSGDPILTALANLLSHTALPTALSVGFIDVPSSGPVLTIDTQIATDVLGYGSDGKQAAAVNIGGVVLNDQGKQAGGFKNRLTVQPSTNTTVQHPGVIYSHKIPLKPGIYQIRVAAGDEKTGRVGSAAKWIEIPDLTSKNLTLSSLMLGGQFIGANQKSSTGEQMQFSVDRRFPKGANLNFLMFIYNAKAGPAPDLEAQIKIIRNGQAVVTSPVLKVPVDGTTDAARVSYGANVGLRQLPPGRYALEVAITDKLAKTTAMQQASFDIE
ncbi:MAG TPA: VWA domain-containing protein [Pyrinomonadaceae bacterium]|nr:VWA domain-containing protein [Pyrinomonadaceae bacterium]